MAEIRHIFSKHGGNLGEKNSVAFLFERKSHVLIEGGKATEDELMAAVLDAGAEDIKLEGDYHEITCDINDLEAVKEALKAKNIPMVTAEMTMIPSSTVKVTGDDVKTLLALMEALEDHEDVQHVYANFDIPDEEMEKASS